MGYNKIFPLSSLSKFLFPYSCFLLLKYEKRLEFSKEEVGVEFFFYFSTWELLEGKDPLPRYCSTSDDERGETVTVLRF